MLRTLAIVCGGLGLIDVAYIDLSLGPRTFASAPASTAREAAAVGALRAPDALVAQPPPGTLPRPAVASAPNEPSAGASAQAIAVAAPATHAADLWVVRFADSGQSALSEEAKLQLRQIAEEFAERRDVNVSIVGHADERGESRENLWLGERRAHTVAEALLGAGFSADQIEVRSQGEAAPVVPGSDSEAWAENRRVDIEIRAKRRDRP